MNQTPSFALYRTIVVATDVANVQANCNVLAASLCKDADIPFQVDPATRREFIVAAVLNPRKGYSFTSTPPVITPLPLPAFNTPEACTGIYVSDTTPPHPGYFSVWAVVSLPANSPLPVNFVCFHDPTPTDANHWLVCPTAEHDLAVQGYTRFIPTMTTLPWRWEGILKMRASSGAPDMFEDGMDGTAHMIAVRLNEWQGLAGLSEELFADMGALQEHLRTARYRPLSADLLARCVQRGRHLLGFGASTEDVDRIDAFCELYHSLAAA